MKTRQAYNKSSKDTLIARYLKETSAVDYSKSHNLDLKELGKSMLASMEKLKGFGGFHKAKF